MLLRGRETPRQVLTLLDESDDCALRDWYAAGAGPGAECLTKPFTLLASPLPTSAADDQLLAPVGQRLQHAAARRTQWRPARQSHAVSGLRPLAQG